MFNTKAQVVTINPKETVGARQSEKRDIVLEYDLESKFPKKLVVTFWGDKISALDEFSEGDQVDASFRVESREYNGRWFTNCSGISISKDSGISEEPPVNDGAPAPIPPEHADEEDMPF